MSDEIRGLRDDVVRELRKIIQDGVESVGPDGKPTGQKKAAPASYFAVAARICHAAGVSASDSQANDLARDIAAATGTPFVPKLVDDLDEEVA